MPQVEVIAVTGSYEDWGEVHSHHIPETCTTFDSIQAAWEQREKLKRIQNMKHNIMEAEKCTLFWSWATSRRLSVTIGNRQTEQKRKVRKKCSSRLPYNMSTFKWQVFKLLRIGTTIWIPYSHVLGCISLISAHVLLSSSCLWILKLNLLMILHELSVHPPQLY